jgi:hypothetical protein
MTQAHKPCKAEVLRTQPLGMRAVNGDEMYAFVLRVIVDGHVHSEVQIGSPVPVAAMSLLRPGTVLPALQPSDGDDTELVVDWEAAIQREAD